MTQKELEHYWMLMKKKGIKQKDVSAYIGCSEGLVSLFLNGKCSISREKEDKIKKYLAETNNTKVINIQINID